MRANMSLAKNHFIRKEIFNMFSGKLNITVFTGRAALKKVRLDLFSIFNKK